MPSPDRHFANAAIFTQSTGVTPNSGDAALYIKTDNKLYVKNSSGTEAQVTADMVGATSSAAGTAGLVPAPAAGDQEATLIGDATFARNLFRPSFKPITKSSRLFFNAGMISRPEQSSTPNYTNTTDAPLMPFFVAGSETVSSVSIMNHTSSVSTVTFKIAIYQSDFLTSAPKTLVQQVQTANVGNSAAAGTVFSTNFNAAVRGLYWIAVYNETLTSFALKATDQNVNPNPVLCEILGVDAYGSSARRKLGVKVASISSNVFPSTLTSSDLSFGTSAENQPTIAVGYS